MVLGWDQLLGVQCRTSPTSRYVSLNPYAAFGERGGIWRKTNSEGLFERIHRCAIDLVDIVEALDDRGHISSPVWVFCFG
jgi:hypothetical protein